MSMYKAEAVVVGKFMHLLVNQLRLQSSKAFNLHSKLAFHPRHLNQPVYRLLHNMAQQYASKQPSGFNNHIKNVAIVGVRSPNPSRFFKSASFPSLFHIFNSFLANPSFLSSPTHIPTGRRPNRQIRRRLAPR